MTFGYATNETPELMPMPIALAHRLSARLAQVRKDGTLPYLRPDGKTQVTVRYRNNVPVAVEKVLISAQHADDVSSEQIRNDLWDQVVLTVLHAGFYDEAQLAPNLYVNPTGRFVIGGPVGDAGLTGLKIIVDTYGGFARHGGDAFSGKDPSKVDRYAAYAARYVAKNIVGPGWRTAPKCKWPTRSASPGRFHCWWKPLAPSNRKIGERALRPAAGGFPQLSWTTPTYLRQDRRLRPLRARRSRFHLGAHR